MHTEGQLGATSTSDWDTILNATKYDGGRTKCKGVEEQQEKCGPAPEEADDWILNVPQKLIEEEVKHVG